MRIKQLELNGFKSFMARTVLEFPPGVTAIVGPNGCGKSNVVDAIRWVLGEQSAKHLRGDAMEDVICNGSADSGPLGMAEVSMVLERSETDLARSAAENEAEGSGGEEALPPEVANLSEVLVTRRYFRSGESEYFINRVPCRLKDITELFLGTGVGTKAYAIIEQGRIEQLVNAKPEEMRLFIEEAAGVTRFRHRKVAAERKMERTRDNLVRVQDVLRELERQQTSLERQARRAEEYHRVKDELRQLDLVVMAAQHRTWSGELARIHDELAAVQQEEARLQEELLRVQSLGSEARASRMADEERLGVVDATLTEERLAAVEAQARIGALGARRGELETQAARAEREALDMASRLEAVGVELERLDRERVGLSGEQDEALRERARAEARLEELAGEGSPLEQTVETTKDGLLDALAEEVRLRNMFDVLRQRRDELDGQRRKLEEEQRLLGERLQANANAVEVMRASLVRLAGEQSAAQNERQQLADAQADLAREDSVRRVAHEAARAAFTQLESRVSSLRELQARYEGCTRGAASVLARDAQASLLATVLRVPPPLERAVAAALGVRLGQVVVPDSASAVQAVRWLRDASGGRATILPRDPDRRAAVIVPAGRRLLDQIEVDPQHWALAEAVLGHVLLADDLDAALDVWREASHAVTVVTVAGEALDPLGAVTGGSEPPLEETLLARARELRELEQSVAESEKIVAAEAQALAAVQARVEETAARVAAVEERLQALRLERLAAEKDRERLDEERARITTELEVGALEASGLAGADDRVVEELSGLEERRMRAEHEATARREELAERQAALGAWREAHAAAERTLTAAAVRVAAVTERLRAVEAAVLRGREGTHELEERRVVAVQLGTEAAAGAAAAAAEAIAAEEARQRANARVQTLSAEREQLRAAINAAEARFSADERAEHATRQQLEALREQRGRAEITLAERRMAIGHLEAQLAERYDLGLSALGDVPLAEEGIEEERVARVEALRRRLLQLGDVNPAALTELEEIRTRYDFLVEQRTDLERSLDDLRRTILKLTRTSRHRFEETFEAANEKLAEMFPKLFPGGKAQLELVALEESDEPGVHIVVQPAGKKLQHLSLLSGGEKALTATALVLSLFLIRPTPFCLLDEVDAPLDEANIGRFNQIVRDMAQTSQFVLITHNRRTMEVADTLYGITMEQPGVSKIVSVKLREAA
jgi:chromosome segregation protein